MRYVFIGLCLTVVYIILAYYMNIARQATGPTLGNWRPCSNCS